MFLHSRGKFYPGGQALWCGVGGRDIGFWMDDWVGVRPPCELFPRVFMVVSNKESKVIYYYEVKEGCISWSVSFKRSLCQ